MVKEAIHPAGFAVFTGLRYRVQYSSHSDPSFMRTAPRMLRNTPTLRCHASRHKCTSVDSLAIAALGKFGLGLGKHAAKMRKGLVPFAGCLFIEVLEEFEQE